jgi:hypothetical protein
MKLFIVLLFLATVIIAKAEVSEIQKMLNRCQLDLRITKFRVVRLEMRNEGSKKDFEKIMKKLKMANLQVQEMNAKLGKMDKTPSDDKLRRSLDEDQKKLKETLDKILADLDEKMKMYKKQSGLKSFKFQESNGIFNKKIN